MSTQVVILTASSGGGHNSAANALRALIEERLCDTCEFTLIDVYQKNLFHRLPVLARIRYHSDLLWHLILSLTNNKLITRATAWMMRPFMIHSIEKQLPERCDYLIAVHFNPAHCLPQLAARFGRQPRTAIVATDFDPHWAWFGKDADVIFVASPAGQTKALESGYSAQQVFQLPLIPTEKIPYRKPISSAPARLRLGIVSGQDGSNPRQILKLLDILAALPNKDTIKVSVYCGKNTRLQHQLHQQLERFAPLQLEIHGYTKNLKSRFHLYDMMLIRTSPGVLSECICAGVPVIGFDWSAHEHYQQEFIEIHKIGFSSKVLSELKSYLHRLLTHPQALFALQENVDVLRRRNSSQAMLSHLLTSEAN